MTNITSDAKPKTKKSGNAALPPKPYSEYTIFFRLERAYILQSTGIIDDEVFQLLDPNHQDPLEFPRPAKYQSLALTPYWYSSSHKKAIEKKRTHRKRQGRISLQVLSKTISASWKKCDSDIAEYCKRLAQAEWNKYSMTMFVIKAEQEAGKAVKPVHQNGALSHEDFIIQSPKSQVQAQTSGSIPVITPSTTPFTNSMQNNFNKVMGYGQINEGQNNDTSFLKMQTFEQLQAIVGMGNISPNGARLTSPLNTNYLPIPVTSNISGPSSSEKKRKFVREASTPPEFADIKPYVELNSSSNYFGTNNNAGMNSPDFSCGSLDSNGNVLLGEDSLVLAKPEQEMRRPASMTSIPVHEDQVLKQMRHASTTSSMPESIGQPMLCGSTGGIGNVFDGEDISVLANPEKKMRRHAHIVSLPTHANQEVSKQMRCPFMNYSMPEPGQPSVELRSSFTKQVQRGSFTRVPEWKEEDVDVLLGMLSEPEVKDDSLQFGRDDFVLFDQDIMTIFLDEQNFDDDFLSAVVDRMIFV